MRQHNVFDQCTADSIETVKIMGSLVSGLVSTRRIPLGYIFYLKKVLTYIYYYYCMVYDMQALKTFPFVCLHNWQEMQDYSLLKRVHIL